MDFDRDGGNTTISGIQRNIQELNKKVQTLDGFIPRLSEAGGGGERYREEFNEMAQSAQALSKSTNQLMVELVKLSNSDRSLRIHRERLQNEYIGVLNRLQGVQRRAANMEKASMKEVRDAAANQSENPFEDTEAQVQTQRQQQVNIQEIKERTQALRQLEQDMGDVNQIFADLARIVHEQGDMVDSIEANVEHAQIHVDQGATNVQQAVYYNQKARQKKLMLFVFLVVLVFIIGLTVYLAH